MSIFEKMIRCKITRFRLSIFPRAFFPQALDAGEAAAISLAIQHRADLLLMDDREGVAAARRAGFTVTGTLGVLCLAAERGPINLPEAFERLRCTSFRSRPEMMEQLLRRFSGGKS